MTNHKTLLLLLLTALAPVFVGPRAASALPCDLKPGWYFVCSFPNSCAYPKLCGRSIYVGANGCILSIGNPRCDLWCGPFPPNNNTQASSAEGSRRPTDPHLPIEALATLVDTESASVLSENNPILLFSGAADFDQAQGMAASSGSSVASIHEEADPYLGEKVPISTDTLPVFEAASAPSTHEMIGGK